MKAIICEKYGASNILQLKDVEKPSPKDNEVLIKIYASSITAADMMMRKGSPWIGRLFLGLTKPKKSIPGTGFSGEIEAIGKDIKRFKVGELVFGESAFGSGTNAEYVCMPEDGLLAEKPNNMTHEEACPICDGPLTSLNFLKELANIQSGQRVLINGASGSLGSSAIQIAKHFGATVTGVCSTANVEMVKSLGANTVIDYTKEDFTKNGQTYDIIYDTVGKSSFSRCKNILTRNGIYLCPAVSLSLPFYMLWTSVIGTKKAMFSATGLKPMKELQRLLKELTVLIEKGVIISVIDKTYPLEQTAEAHSYVDTGHKKGNVVIAMENSA